MRWLQAKHRWAVSGTPVQNKVHELFSYFQFLQYHPFNTKAAFDEYMRKVEAMPNPKHALERLSEMIRPVMLRRTKESKFDGQRILMLPDRYSSINTLVFTHSLTHSLTHSITQLLTHSLTPSSLTHWLNSLLAHPHACLVHNTCHAACGLHLPVTHFACCQLHSRHFPCYVTFPIKNKV